MKKNILFSTTRQWNPGDEFILLGVINILKEILKDFNPIIYNRNPSIRPKYSYLNFLYNSRFFSNRFFLLKSQLESFFRIGFYDNSFKDYTSLDFMDTVIFAGTPEWFGARLLPLYKKLLNYEKPILFLGIGTALENKKIKPIYDKVLNKAKLITTRDELTYKFLRKRYNNVIM